MAEYNCTLKVGDRVAVYGTLAGGAMVEGLRGIVVPNDRTYGPENDGWITVDFDGAAGLHRKHVHPKQCRRLKRRERRRWLLNVRPDGEVRGAEPLGRDAPCLGAFYSDNETVEVVEVRK